MKLRCPYCKAELAEIASICPHCQRTMVIPGSVRRRTARERKEARDRLQREFQRKEQEAALREVPDLRLGRNPGLLVLILLSFLVLGGLLISRSGQVKPANSPPRTNLATARKEVRNLRIAIERYRQDVGHYPTAAEGGLLALIFNPGVWGWFQPYVNLIRADPWRSTYVYRSTNDSVRVFSCGPDRRPDTADDIVAAKPTPEEVSRPPAPGATTNEPPAEGEGATNAPPDGPEAVESP